MNPFGQLYTSNPLKKIALASLRSNLDKMDSSDPNLIRSKSVEELNKSKEKIHQNPNPQKNAKEQKRKSPVSPLSGKDKEHGSKIKRIQKDHFKSFSSNTTGSQSKKNLAESKEK